MKDRKFIYILSTMLLVILCGTIILTACDDDPTTPAYVFYDQAEDISGSRQLFLDTLLINEEKTTAQATLNSPVRSEEVILFNDPWQGNCCDYFTVFEDIDKNGVKFFRLYYIGRWIYSEEYPDVLRICYAYSYDGYNWEFPNLGLREVNGNKNNNVILDDTDQLFDNFFVFKDSNPECDPSEKYKALGEYYEYLGGPVDLRAWVSPDGINWTCKGTVMAPGMGTFDSLNTCYYDDAINKYVLYSRNMFYDAQGISYRAIQRSESDDFYTWSAPKFISYADGENMQMYTNNISRYYRAPQYYIGHPTRYTSPDEISPGADRVTDSIFIFSRDGLAFERTSETWILNRPKDDINWTYGDSYFAAGILQTKDAFGNDVMSFYTNEDRFSETGTKFVKYDMRLDGFVSYDALGCNADVVTKPVKFSAGSLYLNYRTGIGGEIVVSLEDKNGATLLKTTLTGDFTDKLVFNDEQLAPFKDKGIVLKIQLRDAQVYSYMFD